MEKIENIFDILEELVAEVKSRQWDTEEDVWGAEAKLIDEYSEKIELKLSEAREEGVKMGMENAWEMVSALLDTLDINKNEEEIRILTGINKLFDREITKLALKLKNNK